MLAAAGALHIGLLGDLEGTRNWTIALLVGAVGFQINLAVAVVLGLALWWLPILIGSFLATKRGGSDGPER
jgi:hypothetical protein